MAGGLASAPPGDLMSPNGWIRQAGAMVEVALYHSLRPFADGEAVVEVDASTVGEVLSGLVSAHPGLAAHIEAGVSVAVDGRVIASGLTEPVRPDSEVVILQQLKGG